MANVTFHVGTTTPGSSGLTSDGLYVDKTNGQIFYATSATAKKQIGSSMKMMSDKGWIFVNGTSGTLLTSLSSTLTNTIVNYARDIAVSVSGIPEGTLFPAATSSTSTHPLNMILTRNPYAGASGKEFYGINMMAGMTCVSTSTGKSEVVFVSQFNVGLSGTPSVSWTYQRIRQNSEVGNIYGVGHSRSDDITRYVKLIAYRF